MNEKKILLNVLMIGLIMLTMAFVLLFVYVDIRWFDVKTLAINPVHTVIATAIMIATGVFVHIRRNRKS